MPIHDRTRETAGTFHAFQRSLSSEIQLALNRGLLPADHYAQAERIVGTMGPDCLTLQTDNAPKNGAFTGSEPAPADCGGGLAVATSPSQVCFEAEAESFECAQKRQRLVIRLSSRDRIDRLCGNCGITVGRRRISALS